MRDLQDHGRPVFPGQAVTPAYGLRQTPLPIHQRDRDAIDFRLYPQAGLATHPARHVGLIRQFTHAGVRHRMSGIPLAAEAQSERESRR